MPVRHRTQTQCMTEVHAHDTEAVTIFISLCTLFGGQTLTSGNALQPFPPPSDSEVFLGCWKKQNRKKVLCNLSL